MATHKSPPPRLFRPYIQSLFVHSYTAVHIFYPKCRPYIKRNSKYLLKILSRPDAYFITLKHSEFRKSCWNFPYGDNFKLDSNNTYGIVVGYGWVENLLKILFYHESRAIHKCLDLIENKYMYHGRRLNTHLYMCVCGGCICMCSG